MYLHILQMDDVNYILCLQVIPMPLVFRYKKRGTPINISIIFCLFLCSPKGEGGILFYLLPSIQDIFRRIFLSNCWWQKSYIWSQASYRYTRDITPYRGKRFWTHQIPTSCLPTLLIFTHIEHTFCICPFLVTFFSATIDGRNLIFAWYHKLHIGTPYCGKRCLTRQIPISCLPKSGGIISEH